MAIAITALTAALLASIFGPLVLKLWAEPKAVREQKARTCYEVFIENLDGLYTSTLSEEKIAEVCLQYRMAWLYAKDEVVESLNNFLQSEKLQVESPKAESTEWKLGAAVLEMRKRNLWRTRLTPADYLLATPAQLAKKEHSGP